MVDYRGFADSEGSPTEAGVNLDAKTAWDWLVTNGAAQDNILVLGHSLGTGVATKLVSELAYEGNFLTLAPDYKPTHTPFRRLSEGACSGGTILRCGKAPGDLLVRRDLASLQTTTDLPLRVE